MCRPKLGCGLKKAAGEWHREKGRGCRADLLQFVKNGKGNMQAYYLSSTCQFSFSFFMSTAASRRAGSSQQAAAPGSGSQQAAGSSCKHEAASSSGSNWRQQQAGSRQ